MQVRQTSLSPQHRRQCHRVRKRPDRLLQERRAFVWDRGRELGMTNRIDLVFAGHAHSPSSPAVQSRLGLVGCGSETKRPARRPRLRDVRRRGQIATPSTTGRSARPPTSLRRRKAAQRRGSNNTLTVKGTCASGYRRRRQQDHLRDGRQRAVRRRPEQHRHLQEGDPKVDDLARATRSRGYGSAYTPEDTLSFRRIASDTATRSARFSSTKAPSSGST
jgi:hypothetical protein